jgi:hypothetical protein
VDGTANLTCEDSTTYHPLDGWEPTHDSEGRRFESDLALQATEGTFRRELAGFYERVGASMPAAIALHGRGGCSQGLLVGGMIWSTTAGISAVRPC